MPKFISNEDYHQTNKNMRVKLIKKFTNYPDKVIYEGTLRGALRRIPKAKKKQYEIVSLEDL